MCFIASSLGGGNDYDNLVWMTKAANIGNFGKTERTVRNLLNDGTCSSVYYCVKFDESSFYSTDIEEITSSENTEDENDEPASYTFDESAPYTFDEPAPYTFDESASYTFGLGRIIGKIGKIGKPKPRPGSGRSDSRKENKKPGTAVKRCSMIWKSKTICAPTKFEQTYECRKSGKIVLKESVTTFN